MPHISVSEDPILVLQPSVDLWRWLRRILNGGKVTSSQGLCRQRSGEVGGSDRDLGQGRHPGRASRCGRGELIPRSSRGEEVPPMSRLLKRGSEKGRKPIAGDEMEIGPMRLRLPNLTRPSLLSVSTLFASLLPLDCPSTAPRRRAQDDLTSRKASKRRLQRTLVWSKTLRARPRGSRRNLSIQNGRLRRIALPHVQRCVTPLTCSHLSSTDAEACRDRKDPC